MPFVSLAGSLKTILKLLFVIPTKAGIHDFQGVTLHVDSPVKPGNDECGTFSACYTASPNLLRATKLSTSKGFTEKKISGVISSVSMAECEVQRTENCIVSYEDAPRKTKPAQVKLFLICSPDISAFK